MKDLTYQTLVLEQPGEHVLTVRINRPEVRNAISTQVGADLHDVFTRLINDTQDYRCVILTGTGDKAFCAGGDLKEMADTALEIPPADFRFSQDEDETTIEEVAKGSAARIDWTPRFIDYLYTSLSNSMAFSASDAMPLRQRTKLLMGLQAFGGFVILALVIARSVGILD